MEGRRRKVRRKEENGAGNRYQGNRTALRGVGKHRLKGAEREELRQGRDPETSHGRCQAEQLSAESARQEPQAGGSQDDLYDDPELRKSYFSELFYLLQKHY